MPKDLLTTVDAAAIIGVSRRRVLALITEGRLPAEKVGFQYLIKRKDLAKVKDRKPGRPRTKGAK